MTGTVSALEAARQALQILEQHEQATDKETRLGLSIKARGWLCLAADSLQAPQEPATVQIRVQPGQRMGTELANVLLNTIRRKHPDA